MLVKLADGWQINVREHLRDISQQSDELIPNHVNSHNHRGADDLCVTGIKSRYSDTVVRLNMEGHFIFSLGCIHPGGIYIFIDSIVLIIPPLTLLIHLG